ncbi:uncharacterized protein [Cicer arietinum]|uniref:uncharacterized protein n=1 Tax=Cicer arietinum TaxID=3827 RepID=UPI003CC52E3B
MDVVVREGDGNGKKMVRCKFFLRFLTLPLPLLSPTLPLPLLSLTLPLPLLSLILLLHHLQMTDEHEASSSDSEISPSLSSSKDSLLNPRILYFLHPDENLGATVVSVLLNDNNYHTWSKLMRRALSSKNKIRFINGTLPQPLSTNSDFESTICIDSTSELWADLRDRFTQGNHFRFSDLLRDLHSIKQGEHSLSSYFTDLKILWDELEDLRPTPSCTCPIPCSCKLNTTVRDFKHEEYISYFLKGLNENYNNVRTQILFMDHLPSISKVYYLVVQQDLVPNSTHNPPDTVVAFNINTPNNSNQGRGCGRGQPRPSMFCTHCHKNNHTVDTCYFKHGFPPGYRKNQFANLSSTNDSKNYFLSQPPQQPDSNKHFSKEDYQILINLLHHSKSDATTKNSVPDQSNHIVSSISNTGFVSNRLSLWIMDSGASDHDLHTQKTIGHVEHRNSLYILDHIPASAIVLSTESGPISNDHCIDFVNATLPHKFDV